MERAEGRAHRGVWIRRAHSVMTAARPPAAIAAAGALATATGALGLAARWSPSAHARAPSPAGSLRQAAGRPGCFLDPAQRGPRDRCARARGLGSTQNVVISPDGRNLYAPSNFTWGLVAFGRDPRNGRLRQLPGRAGCLTSQSLAGCTPARGLVWAFWAAVSPDGSNVYVSGGIGNAIAILNRDPSTGALAQSAGPAGCLRNRSGGTTQGGPEAHASGCQLVDGLLYPRTVALDPGGSFLYAADFDGDSISAFRRGVGGTLTPAPGACVSSRPVSACGPAADLNGATDLAISTDGRFLYATAFRGNAVDAFLRDPRTGALHQLAGSGGCLASVPAAGCGAGRGLRGAYNLALSPDGRSLYVASRFSAAVAVLDRDPASGALSQRAGPAGCVASATGEGCQPARGLRGARGVTVSPDGRSVYTGAFSDSTVAIFARSANGSLHQLSRRAGCVSEALTVRSCQSGRALRGAWGLAVSADGRFLYSGVGGDGNSGLAVFGRVR